MCTFEMSFVGLFVPCVCEFFFLLHSLSCGANLSCVVNCYASLGMEGFGWNHEWDMSNILLGGAAHWSASGVKWILALDETCGPTLPLVTYKNGRPLVSIPSYAASESDIYFNQDYYSIKHMSRYLSATDAESTVRVTTTTTTAAAVAAATATTSPSTVPNKSKANDAISSVLVESFYNAKTNIVTVIAMNKDHENDIEVQMTQGGESFSDMLPLFSTKIYQWIKA
jgi:hypothetical protein